MVAPIQALPPTNDCHPSLRCVLQASTCVDAARQPNHQSRPAENAARLVLSQLSERLSFSKHPSNNDEEMECLQFGICSYQVQPQRVSF